MWTTDLGRINDRWYRPYMISKFSLSMLLTWFFIFFLYVASIKWVEALAQHPLTVDFPEAWDYYMITQGLGMITATALAPLFGFYFLVDMLEAHRTDRDLIKDFQRTHPQRR